MANVDFKNPDSLAELSEAEIRAAVEGDHESEETSSGSAEDTGAAGVEASGDGGGAGEAVTGSGSTEDNAGEAGQEAAEGSPGHTVPVGALVAERQQKADWKAQAAYYKGLYDQQMAQAAAAAAAAAPEEEPADPFLRIEKKLEKVQEQQQLTQQQQQYLQYQAQQKQFFEAAASVVKQQTEQFVTAHPDYSEAVKHVARVKLHEYSVNGVPDPQGKFLGDLTASAVETVREGKNAPEALYSYAQMLGYRPQAAPPSAPGLVKQRPISLSQVPASSPSTIREGKFSPVDLWKKNPAELERLSRLENAAELEKIMREAEMGS